MADQPQLYIAGFSVESLNGDESYVVTVFYRDAQGNPGGNPDKFSFSTAAKLKKFVHKLVSPAEEEAAETGDVEPTE